MIQYDNEIGIISLNTDSSTYVIGILNDLPICLYWGGRIHAQDLRGFSKTVHHSSFDSNILLERSEYPVWDSRSFIGNCFKANENMFMRISNYDIQRDRLIITLTDEKNEHAIELIYQVDAEHDTIIKSTRFICGQKPVQIRRFFSASFSLPNTGSNYTMHYRVGAWANEFKKRKRVITEGRFRIESTRGLSGPHYNPAIAIVGENDEAYGAMLGWSGSWQMTVEKSIFGNININAGWNDFDFKAVLSRGEDLISPPLYLCFAEDGIGSLTRKLHDYQRHRLSSNAGDRRILYNSWEATYFNVNVVDQMLLADRAALLGIELFVVDDGWFGQRKDDTAGLGDWYVNSEKFPNGLQQLIDHVTSKGMAFGLWVEPESVNPDSDLYREHPEWAYSLDGHQPLMFRNQYLLNLGRKDVVDYIKKTLFNLLKQYDISYLKWDMNRPFTDVSEEISPMARELHVEAVYDILKEIRDEFPSVDIEACSGGGARVDLGMMRLTDQFWPSDNTDPFQRLLIQDGCATFYLPKMTSCWVTDSNSGVYGSTLQELQYRFHVSMSGGTLGIGANITQFNSEQMELASKMIATYKGVRRVIFNGDRYSVGDPATDEYHLVQYVTKNQLETVAFIFRSTSIKPVIGNRVKLHGLNEELLYTSIEAEQCIMYGCSLMRLGLSLSMPTSQRSMMFYFKAAIP